MTDEGAGHVATLRPASEDGHRGIPPYGPICCKAGVEVESGIETRAKTLGDFRKVTAER